MRLRHILNKVIFWNRKEFSKLLAPLNGLVYLPSRESLKDKTDLLNILDLYKTKYSQILSNKRIVMSRDLEIESIQNLNLMYTELLLNLVMEDDLTLSFRKALYYNVGTTKIEYMCKMAKIKSYIYELEQIYIKVQLQLVALTEILEEKKLLSPHKINCIKEKINSLVSTIIMIETQTRALKFEVDSYLKDYECSSDESISDEELQVIINEKCNELRVMISLLMPDKIKELGISEDSITNLVLMEKILEEYIFNHKDDATDLKSLIANRVLFVKDDLEMREITPQLNYLELKLKAFSLYGRNLINDDDIKNFYAIKFSCLTRSMLENKDFNIVETASYYEVECYIDIISKKISDIITGNNEIWNKYFYNNESALKSFVSFMKTNNQFDYWNILTSNNLLSFLVAFDKPYGLEEYFANTYVPKKDYSEVDFHENEYQYSKIVKFRTKEFPYFNRRIKKYNLKFFEFADNLPLYTVFKMAYYNGEDLNNPLYNIFKIMYSKIEEIDSTFRLPEGLIRINVPNEAVYDSDAKIKDLFRVLAKDKDIETPSSLVGISGPLFKNISVGDIYLNEGLKEIGFKVFSGVTAKSIHIPKSLTEIDETAFQETNISELYFNNFEDSPLNEFRNNNLFNLLQHFFFASEVGTKRYHFVSEYVKEKQRAYQEGRYSTFLDTDLFDRDSVFQDFKISNSCQVIFEKDTIPFISFDIDSINIVSTRDITYHSPKLYHGYKFVDGSRIMKVEISFDEGKKLQQHLLELCKSNNKVKKKNQ